MTPIRTTKAANDGHSLSTKLSTVAFRVAVTDSTNFEEKKLGNAVVVVKLYQNSTKKLLGRNPASELQKLKTIQLW